MVHDILDLEKLNAGKMQFDMRSIDLVPVLRQAIEMNANFAQTYQVRYELDCTIGQANVWGDADRLLQVLTNLMSNAAKYSPPNEAVIIRLQEHENQWRIEVIDKGSGIPKNFYASIFDSFSQADNTDARQKQGTGLGLKISKSMVELMDGQIGFVSDEGNGCNFWISFDKL